MISRAELYAEGPQGGNAPAGEPAATISDIVRAGNKWFPRPAARSDAAAADLHDAELRGSSTSAARKSAHAALPLDKLSPENQHRVAGLLKSVSFFRRLPKVSFPVEPDVYGYFVAHPDVAVSIWRAMKISKLQMWQTGRFDYEADTGDGSIGKLEVVHAGPEQQLVFCDGEYKSPLFSKPIAARSLLLLQTSFIKEADGTMYCTHRANLWVSFPSQTVDVVSKIFSPLAVTLTDRTFTEISLFLKMISLAMTHRPDWVEQIAETMEGVPELRKQQVMSLTAEVYASAQKRLLERAVDSDGHSHGPREPARLANPGGQPQTATPLSAERTAPAPPTRTVSAEKAPQRPN
ncbi:MAG: hypothetical protein ACT4QC_06480 [Planctomycetaceae bacterium]